jgi:hypothetical protein
LSCDENFQSSLEDPSPITPSDLRFELIHIWFENGIGKFHQGSKS